MLKQQTLRFISTPKTGANFDSNESWFLEVKSSMTQMMSMIYKRKIKWQEEK